MTLIELLKKGLRFLLMSMGVSSPEKKHSVPGSGTKSLP